MTKTLSLDMPTSNLNNVQKYLNGCIRKMASTTIVGSLRPIYYDLGV